MPTFSVLTLGCKLNQYESMGIVAELERIGLEKVEPENGADFYIINTCTVTSKTDRRSRQLVRRVPKWNPKARIIVTGCGVQNDASIFETLPNVWILAGNPEKVRLAKIITDAAPNEQTIAVGDAASSFENISITRFGSYTRAFLKIQEGCNGNCSYCIIPRVRGKSRSGKPDDVRREVLGLAGAYNEIVFTGIDLGSYGKDLVPETNLVELLKILSGEEKIKRLRLSSIEPTPMIFNLIDLMRSQEKICRHLHIPLQSGSDVILRRMNRRYSKTDYREIIETCRNLSDELCIGADVIVGFPGETRELFLEMKEYLKDLPVNYLHVFTYSVRKGTPAAGFPHHVEPAEAKRRCHSLRELSFSKSVMFRKRMLNKTLSAVILGDDKKNGVTVALSDNYIRIFLEGAVPARGTIAPVKIRKVSGLNVWGVAL